MIPSDGKRESFKCHWWYLEKQLIWSHFMCFFSSLFEEKKLSHYQTMLRKRDTASQSSLQLNRKRVSSVIDMVFSPLFHFIETRKRAGFMYSRCFFANNKQSFPDVDNLKGWQPRL